MTLSALTLLDGYHLDAPDSAAFVGAKVSVENLTGWDQLERPGRRRTSPLECGGDWHQFRAHRR